VTNDIFLIGDTFGLLNQLQTIKASILTTRRRDILLTSQNFHLLTSYSYTGEHSKYSKHEYLVTWKPAGPSYLLFTTILDDSTEPISYLFPATMDEQYNTLLHCWRIPGLTFTLPKISGTCLLGDLFCETDKNGKSIQRFLTWDCLSFNKKSMEGGKKQTTTNSFQFCASLIVVWNFFIF
jgi:hypothetical protein